MSQETFVFTSLAYVLCKNSVQCYLSLLSWKSFIVKYDCHMYNFYTVLCSSLRFISVCFFFISLLASYVLIMGVELRRCILFSGLLICKNILFLKNMDLGEMYINSRSLL